MFQITWSITLLKKKKTTLQAQGKPRGKRLYENKAPIQNGLETKMGFKWPIYREQAMGTTFRGI